MGIYHLCLYGLRRTDKSPLYFAIFCGFISLRESFSEDALIYDAFPSIDFELSLKVLYAIFPICLITFIKFIECLCNQYNIFMKWLAIMASLTYLLLICLTTNNTYGLYLPYFCLLVFVESIYWLVLVAKNMTGQVKENILLFSGLCLLVACFINDVLSEAGITKSYLLPLGVFLFILFQSILLAIRSSNAFKTSERLGFALEKSTVAYEEALLMQRQAEELKAIEELKNRFFSNITHAFRTPLTLIISPIERLLQGYTSPTILEKSLKTVHRNAINLLLLINQLLDLSKLEAKNMHVVKYSGNVRQFIEELIIAFQLKAEEREIKLEASFAGMPNELIFDAEKLEKICFNLLSNAFKFTPSGGVISLSVIYEASTLQVTVQDSGIGIENDKLSYIFNRFYQVDNSLTREYGGTGIGLALVKELVELVQGTIEVSSQPGSGTTFNVSFPVEEVTAVQNYPRPTPNLSQSILPYQPSNEVTDQNKSQAPSILIVEDNLDLLNYLIEDLSLQYNILFALNGQEAWEICQSELPDLVVSDIMMPLMDGYRLCELIKTNETTNHIGVILLTAKAAAESRIRGLELRANDYISKPFHNQELQLRINNLVEYQKTLRNSLSQQFSYLKQNDNVKQEHPFLTKIYNLIDQQLSNTEFTVSELAKELAMSSKTLNRKLSAIIGLSANELIRNYRLKKAVELLKQGLSVSQTAYSVGFDSPSYFGYCFKEFYKVSPSEILS